MAKKLTTEEFVERSKKVHGQKYDYRLVKYINSKTPIEIICQRHGVFKQLPLNHLYHFKGCSKCCNNLKKTTSQFVKECISKIGNRYDYSMVNYNGNKEKVKIICKKHGAFEVSPIKHLNGSNCPKCVGGVNFDNKDFVDKSNLKHNYRYDYSKVEYVNNSTKVEIICPEHGSFWQSPREHFEGKGCKICAGNSKSSVAEFVQKAMKIHGNKYDYSNCEYVNNFTKVDIKCNKCGLNFKQEPKNHLSGKGCANCNGGVKQTYDEFIEKAKQIHGEKYDYSNVDYQNNRTKVSIICLKHGLFKQSPFNHLNGNGCPKCKSIISKPEIELQDFIKSLGFKIKTNDRKIIKPYELDIYIPELRKAIEFNGTYWHYDKTNPNCKPSCYHSTKSKLCKSLNINLLHLREDLWKKDKEKIKKILIKFLKL